MAEIVDTQWGIYAFTEHEALLASELTTLQVKKLVTMRTTATLAKATDSPLKYEGDIQRYMYVQEYYRGQIEMLTTLINDHRDKIAYLAAEAAAKADNTHVNPGDF
jgi:hypothetical protein